MGPINPKIATNQTQANLVRFGGRDIDEFLQEEDIENLKEWSLVTNSPNLNPIEHLCHKLKRSVY